MKRILIASLMLLSAIGADAQQQQAKCKAITKKQTQCTRKAVINGYCKQHDPKAKRCAGNKQDGTPCTMVVKDGQNFCYHHNGSKQKK
jgi:hypothetical protein